LDPLREEPEFKKLLIKVGLPRPEETKSLAVLPLANLSNDPAQEYFADGMTDELITELSKIKGLLVISRTSVMPYKKTTNSLPEIAKALNVDALVEGSVLRAGDQVRITVQLIHGASDKHLWADSFRRETRDVLTLQSEVALAIAGKIKDTITPQERMRLASARPVNPEASNLYFRGRLLSGRRSQSNSRAEIDLLEQAVALDPGFAAAHAALAQAYVRLYFYLAPEAQRELEAKAALAIEKALALDPNLSEAYLARGLLLWTPGHPWAYEEAIAELRHAVDLNPNSDEALYLLGMTYNHLGLFERAHEAANRAAAISPQNPFPLFCVGNAFAWQGNYRAALDTWASLPKDFGFPGIRGSYTAWTQLQLGQTNEAAATLEEFLKAEPADTGGLLTSVLAILSAKAGDEATAEDRIQKAIQQRQSFGHFHHTAYDIASAYSLMNKTDQAMKWLRDAAEDGFPCYPLFDRDPNLQQVRSHREFPAFINEQKIRWERHKASL
jgi:TolB-like protein/Flp pilus assembly protein TadD